MGVVSAIERERAAALRAVAGEPRAELRGLRLTVGDQVAAVTSPYLALADADRASRGLCDALAMIVTHSDFDLHRRLSPTDPIERVVFDSLEQLRCQSQAPDLPGVVANLATATDAWCRQARAEGVAESGVGLLVYTTIHMVRARLGLGATDEEVDSVIEGPRARLARLLGHALADLAPVAADQAAFAEPAREIARLVAEMAADAGQQARATDSARFRMLAPIDSETVTGTPSGAAARQASSPSLLAELESIGGYRVFSRDHDIELQGHGLYPPARLARARTELDARVRDQAVGARRLAVRLRHVLGSPVGADHWNGQAEGELDRRRLAQLATTIDPQNLYRRPRTVPMPAAAVTLLVDQSGSMRTSRHESLAVIVDTLTRALDLAGVTNEVLGHSTASWAGGRSLAAWKRAGRPQAPGRVADLAHIVYKPADQSWKRARRSLAAMAITDHFRESVDGEAVVWAHRRLLARTEPRKVLVVVSDGAPAESGTALAEADPDYLVAHLARVVATIEASSPVEIVALSVGGAVDSVFARSARVDLDTTPSPADYRRFENLLHGHV